MPPSRVSLLPWEITKAAAVMVLAQMLVLEEQIDDPARRWLVLKTALRSFIGKASPARKSTARKKTSRAPNS